MKLTGIYRKYTIYTLFAVLVLGSVTHYYIFRYSIHRSTDDVLLEYKQDVLEYAAANDTMVSLQELEMQHSRLYCYKVDPGEEQEHAIYDSLIYSNHEKEKVVYRVLRFDVKAGADMYHVMLSQPTLEEDDLMSAVILSLSLLLLLFIVASFLVSSYYTRILWMPFYKLLSQLRQYKVDRLLPSRLPSCGVVEFDEMNDVVHTMMGKIHSDYTALKEFTENTSHELQSPLSIIKAKLELLQQLEMDNPKSQELIQGMQSAVNRMSHFNRALLFIAKINNNQFADEEDVLLNEYIEEYLASYEDILINRKVKVCYRDEAPCPVRMNRMLADRLIMNLLSNAVRYNVNGGQLSVFTNKDTVRICNTYGNVLPKGDLFGRFIKSAQEKEATGLGLTIVKNICLKSRLKVTLDINETTFCVIIKKE